MRCSRAWRARTFKTSARESTYCPISRSVFRTFVQTLVLALLCATRLISARILKLSRIMWGLSSSTVCSKKLARQHGVSLQHMETSTPNTTSGSWEPGRRQMQCAWPTNDIHTMPMSSAQSKRVCRSRSGITKRQTRSSFFQRASQFVPRRRQYFLHRIDQLDTWHPSV